MEGVNKVPWDTQIFGWDCYEIKQPTAELLRSVERIPGHYTVKVPPLAPKADLHDNGFYYCDTLMETYCEKDSFIQHFNPDVSLSRDYDLAKLIEILKGAFVYGRFHRDFALKKELADYRYEFWLTSMHKQNQVFALQYQGNIIGFFAYVGERIALHAIHEKYRGHGLAKFFWSEACRQLFDQGHPRLVSVISAANTAVLNLYISLGFRFRNPVDVYHKFIPGQASGHGASAV